MQIPCRLDSQISQKRQLYGQLRQYLGEVFKDLARNRECEVLEGHMLPDHVHMLISIPPKFSVSQVIGYIKGKSAIHIARNYLGHRRNFTGQQFWARGYHVSTLIDDIDTEKIIKAVKEVGENFKKYMDACLEQAKKLDIKVFIEKMKAQIKI